jgi:hypothetical protein
VSHCTSSSSTDVILINCKPCTVTAVRLHLPLVLDSSCVPTTDWCCQFFVPNVNNVNLLLPPVAPHVMHMYAILGGPRI